MQNVIIHAGLQKDKFKQTTEAKEQLINLKRKDVNLFIN